MSNGLSNIPPTSELFAKHSIKAVHVHYYPPTGTPYPSASGAIEFKDGDYSAARRFDGKDFDDVMRQIFAFLQGIDPNGQSGI